MFFPSNWQWCSNIQWCKGHSFRYLFRTRYLESWTTLIFLRILTVNIAFNLYIHFDVRIHCNYMNMHHLICHHWKDISCAQNTEPSDSTVFYYHEVAALLSFAPWNVLSKLCCTVLKSHDVSYENLWLCYYSSTQHRVAVSRKKERLSRSYSVPLRFKFTPLFLTGQPKDRIFYHAEHGTKSSAILKSFKALGERGFIPLLILLPNSSHTRILLSPSQISCVPVSFSGAITSCPHYLTFLLNSFGKRPAVPWPWCLKRVQNSYFICLIKKWIVHTKWHPV